MTAADPLLVRVAAALGRPVGELLELDRRPVPLAFTPGHLVTLTVRDARTGEILEPTVDVDASVTGPAALVDPAPARAADRVAGGALPTLSPDLLSLLLRHPGLEAIDVVVRTRGGSRATRLPAAGVVALARTDDVVGITLAADPEIADDDD